MDRVAALFDWLVDGAPGASRSEALITRMGTDLRAAGLPLDRVAVFVTTLHPTVIGRAFWWEPNKPIRILDLTLQKQQEPAVKNSPVTEVSATKQVIRKRLSDGVGPADYAVYHELVAEGFADFVCFPIVFLRGETHAVTFATRDSKGFADCDIDDLRRIVRPLARVAEIYALSRTAANLLSTYVGRNSGERILAGNIFKGDIEFIRAIIWFSDLRGFTERTARQTPRETIDMLNALFDSQVPKIEKRGGEILKFIGDGLLAIFPLNGDDAAAMSAAAGAALESADEAFAELEKQNEASKNPVSFGLALHVGSVAYGNIGGSSRLDFTAIGPAVNVAARLEGLTGKLGRRLVLSADLAKHVQRPLEDLGEFELKGVPDRVRVFAPK